MSIVITKIPNPFEPDINIIEVVDYDSSKKLYHYISDLPFGEMGISFIISLGYENQGNRIIKYESVSDLCISIEDGAIISICAEVGYTAAYAVGQLVVAALPAATSYGLAATIGWAVTAATYLAIGYGSSLLLNALSPDVPGAENTSKQIYGWGDISQTNEQGITIPYLYGTNKVSGNIINQYTSVDQENNEILYVMLGICDHEVDSISDFKINNQTYSFYEDVDVYSRLGTANDATVEGFNDVVTQVDQPSKLKTNTPLTKTTTNCERIDIRVTAPNGIYYMDTDGNPSTLYAVHKIAFKATGDITYTTHSVVVGGPVSMILDGLTYTTTKYDHNSDSVITITNTSSPRVDTSNFVGDIVIASNNFGVKYIFDGGQTETQRQQFITDNLTFFNDSNKANRGDMDGKSYITTIDNLDLDIYNIQITRLNDEHDASGKSSDLYFQNYQQRIKQNLIYPGLAKYAIKALATGQLSGGIPSFSCIAEKEMVSIYDEDIVDWDDKPATSPAWIVYDLIVNKGGESTSKIIYDEFASWDAWLTANNISIHGVVISDSNFWAEIQRIATIGRASIIRRGVKYGVFVDKADTMISHVFNNGNIIDNTLKTSWLPKANIANAVEIEYIDPERDYTRQVVTVLSEDYLKDTDSTDRKTTLQVNAAISQEQATNDGVFMLNCNKWLTQTVEFNAYVDSFACTVGDLFYLHQDFIGVDDGDSGRVFAAGNVGADTNPYIVLDKDILLEGSAIYYVMVRLGDGTIVTKQLIPASVSAEVDWSEEAVWAEGIDWDVEDQDEYGSIFTITTPWDVVPSKYDLYTVGSSSSITKTFRVINLSNTNDFVRTITGLEYIDDIYTDRSGTVITEPTWEDTTPEVLDVKLYEHLIYTSTGGYSSIITATWISTLGNRVGDGWDIYLLDSLNNTRQLIATTVKQYSYGINSDLIVGREYKVVVVPTLQGYNLNSSNFETITILGKLAPPSDVENFTGRWDALNRILTFSWDAIEDIDVDYYEIRDGDSLGEIWSTRTLLKADSKSPTSIYLDEVVDDTRYYAIKAVDTSKVYSENQTAIEVAINTSSSSLVSPTGFSATTGSTVDVDGMVWVRATWNAITNDGTFMHYGVKFTDQETGYSVEFTTTDTSYYWPSLRANSLYDFEVWSVNTSGNSTTPTTITDFLTAKDEGTPSIPTNVRVTEFSNGLKVRWDHGDEPDLSHFILYRYHSDTPSEGIKYPTAIASGFTSTIANYVDLPPEVREYFYWVSAVDTSGNESSLSASASGTLSLITETFIGDDSITTPMIQSNQIITDHINTLDLDSVNITATNLSAITTDTGTLTVDVGGSISSGKGSYGDTTAGFWLENYTGIGGRLSIGNLTNGLKWTGSTLEIVGDIITTGNIQADAMTKTASQDFGSVNISYSTIYTTACQLDLSTGGGRVMINYTGIRGTLGSDGTMILTIYRDTTALRSIDITYRDNSDSVAVATIDNGATGDHTYYVKARNASGSTTFTLSHQNLSLVTFKR